MSEDDISDDIDDRLRDEGYGFCMTTKEVAEVLKVDRRTVYEYAEDGLLEATKLRGQNRYTRSGLAGFIARGMG